MNKHATTQNKRKKNNTAALTFVLLSWLMIVFGLIGISEIFPLGLSEMWYYMLFACAALLSLLSFLFKHNPYKLAALIALALGLTLTVFYIMKIDPIEVFKTITATTKEKK